MLSFLETPGNIHLAPPTFSSTEQSSLLRSAPKMKQRLVFSLPPKEVVVVLYFREDGSHTGGSF